MSFNNIIHKANITTNTSQKILIIYITNDFYEKNKDIVILLKRLLDDKYYSRIYVFNSTEFVYFNIYDNSLDNLKRMIAEIKKNNCSFQNNIELIQNFSTYSSTTLLLFFYDDISDEKIIDMNELCNKINVFFYDKNSDSSFIRENCQNINYYTTYGKDLDWKFLYYYNFELEILDKPCNLNKILYLDNYIPLIRDKFVLIDEDKVVDSDVLIDALDKSYDNLLLLNPDDNLYLINNSNNIYTILKEYKKYNNHIKDKLLLYLINYRAKIIINNLIRCKKLKINTSVDEHINIITKYSEKFNVKFTKNQNYKKYFNKISNNQPDLNSIFNFNIDYLNSFFENFDEIVDYYDIDEDDENKMFLKSLELYQSPLTMSNWYDELKNKNSMCMVFGFNTDDNLILGYQQNHINIKDVNINFIPFKDYIESVYINCSNNSQVDFGDINNINILGGHDEIHNSIIPLYISKEHWSVAKKQLNLALSFSIAHNPLFFDKSYINFPFYLLTFLTNKMFNPNSTISDKWTQVYFSFWRTCCQISLENNYHKGVVTYITNFMNDNTCFINTDIYKLTYILGQLNASNNPIKNLPFYKKFFIKVLLRYYFDYITKFYGQKYIQFLHQNYKNNPTEIHSEVISLSVKICKKNSLPIYIILSFMKSMYIFNNISKLYNGFKGFIKEFDDNFSIVNDSIIDIPNFKSYITENKNNDYDFAYNVYNIIDYLTSDEKEAAELGNYFYQHLIEIIKLGNKNYIQKYKEIKYNSPDDIIYDFSKYVDNYVDQ